MQVIKSGNTKALTKKITKRTKAADFIKSGNGKQVHIYAQGIKLLKIAAAQMGGNKALSDHIAASKSKRKVTEHTIGKLLKTATCHPQTWVALYPFIKSVK